MDHTLSIIIPCYNCEKTLREAVDSCYRQNLQEDEFEIVMVDDGSSDGSWSLIQQIATEHNNIKLIQHEENRGGGAARNTGIKGSQGEIIYCLDSDNIFADNSVGKMLDFLESTDADGVAFYERRFFFGDNTQSYESKFCDILDRQIQLEDMFSEAVIMLDNFFFKKTAYEETHGYPEHHGFDTQAFEIEFLAKKLRVLICPNSVFYHRQNQPGHKSYYVREYEKGHISINTFLAFETILELFNDELIELFINFDVFKKNTHGLSENLRSAICAHVQDGNQLLKGDASRSVATKCFIAMSKSLLQHDFETAHEYYVQCLREYGMTPLLLFSLFRIEFGLVGDNTNNLDKTVLQNLSSYGLITKPTYKTIPQYLKPLYKLYKKL